jgi:hypothetical protein
MPTLKRITATPPLRESPLTSSIRRNDDDNDERFSQAPDDGGATRNIIAARHDSIPYASPQLLSIARAVGNSRKDHRAFPSHLLRDVYHDDGRDDDDGGDAALDVVAVILSATTSTTGDGDDVVRLLVSDGSLPRGRCARVIANAPTALLLPSSISAATGLRPGDVMRWNRLEVRRVYDDYDDYDDYNGRDGRTTTSTSGPGRRNRGPRYGVTRRGDDASEDDDDDESDNDGNDNSHHHRPSLSVACDLSISWRDLEAGPTVARLCRIVPFHSSSSAFDDALDSIANRPRPQQPPQTAEEDRDGRRNRRRDGDCFDLLWEEMVPPSMETPRDVVVGLARWYCANARPHFSKVRYGKFQSLPMNRSFLTYFSRFDIITGFSQPPPRQRIGRAVGAICVTSQRPTC